MFCKQLILASEPQPLLHIISKPEKLTIVLLTMPPLFAVMWHYAVTIM